MEKRAEKKPAHRPNSQHKKKENSSKVKHNPHVLEAIRKYGPAGLSSAISKAMPYVKKGYLAYKAIDHMIPFITQIIGLMYGKFETKNCLSSSKNSTSSNLTDEFKLQQISTDPDLLAEFKEQRNILVAAFTGGASEITMSVQSALTPGTIGMSNYNLVLTSTGNSAILAVQLSNIANYTVLQSMFDEYKWEPEFKFLYYSIWSIQASQGDIIAIGAIDYDSGSVTSANSLWNYDTAKLFQLCPVKVSSEALSCSWSGRLQGSPDTDWLSTTNVNIPVAYWKGALQGWGSTVGSCGYITFDARIKMRQSLISN